MTISPLIKSCALSAHNRLARGPRRIVKIYISAMSALSRNVLPRGVGHRIRNSICAAGPWPDVTFAARRVVLGTRTKVAIIPHVGEFDGDALFSRRLDYEAPVFRWLEENAAQLYDLVIEIGANVGVYTVFFDALVKRAPNPKLRSIIAFEPSVEAYRRLCANLTANGTTCVQTFNAAVGPQSGERAFFEPAGHLTNGSFYRDFAGMFSGSVTETRVKMAGPDELDRHLASASNVLIKMDVEGAEPEIISALSPLIQKHRPDLLVEVLPGTAELLERSGALKNYSRFLITDTGLKPEPSFFAAPDGRDWLIRSGA